MIGNKATNKILRVSISLKQNNSETVTNENNGKIPKERHISQEERQETINDVTLI